MSIIHRVFVPSPSSCARRFKLVTNSACLYSTAGSPRHAGIIDAGTILEGAKGRYRLVEQLQRRGQRSTVFKAETLEQDHDCVPSKWVLVKTGHRDDVLTRLNLKREYDAYQIPSIATSQHIRAMHDIVGNPEDLQSNASCSPPCLVLEWLDCTLEEIPAADHARHSILIEKVFEAGLLSLDVLACEKLIHSDIKPDNILISDVDTDCPIVKIGDLGLVRPEGFKGDAQPFAMRAPEVYRVIGCFHRSDVWSLAVTLICWLKPGAFGNDGNHWGVFTDGWCVAKLMQLFPDWKSPPINDGVVQSVFRLAEALTLENDPDKLDERMVKVATLEKELAGMNVEPAVVDLMRRMLVVEMETRPSAVEVLASEEYSALRRAARSTCSNEQSPR